MSESIYGRVVELIAEPVWGPERQAVQPDSRLIEDFKFEPLDVCELIDALNAEFDIEIDEEEAEKVVTVQQLADLVERATDG